MRGPGKGGGEWNMKEAEKGEGRKGKGSEEKMGQEKGKGGNLSSLILILDSGDKSPLVQPSCITSLWWSALCLFQAVVNKDAPPVQQLQQQQQQQQSLPSQSVTTRQTPVAVGVSAASWDGGRGVDAGDDQSQSFLKQKEAELRQKRERERATKPTAGDETFAVSPPAVKVATPTPVTLTSSTSGGDGGIVPKLEFVAVTTATTPAETVSSSLMAPPSQRTSAVTTTMNITTTTTATGVQYDTISMLPCYFNGGLYTASGKKTNHIDNLDIAQWKCQICMNLSTVLYT